jgi:hypothetical protein
MPPRIPRIRDVIVTTLAASLAGAIFADNTRALEATDRPHTQHRLTRTGVALTRSSITIPDAIPDSRPCRSAGTGAR